MRINRWSSRVFFPILLLGWAAIASGTEPLRATLDGVLSRMAERASPQELVGIDGDAVLAMMESGERVIVSGAYQRFAVDRPVIVYVAFHEHPSGPVFWLAERGFTATTATVEIARLRWRLWEKEFAAGEVGLGIPALYPFVPIYFTFVVPVDEAGGPVRVTAIGEEWFGALPARPGESVYDDVNFPLPEQLPAELRGATLLRNHWAHRRGWHLVGRYRATSQPAGPLPDQVVLTWSEDPRHTQTLQWRTRVEDMEAEVHYLPREQWMQLKGRPQPQRAAASSFVIADRFVANDPQIRRHTAVLRDLQPGTSYVYSIVLADGRATSPAEFTTGPQHSGKFAFIYHGDVQEGFAQWAMVINAAQQQRPDAAFHLMIGDLVNRGVQREEWDEFWGIASPLLARTPLVPVIGNHECEGINGHPSLYLQYLELPANGPDGIEPQRAYHFNYGDALFVILDSNLDPAAQSEWLEATLANSSQRWKIVALHHPLYGSDPRRSSENLLQHLLPVLDRQQVDMVLQGHDHSYLRSYPLRAGVIAQQGQSGTVYVTSVGGTKMYAAGEFAYAHVQMSDVMTWQLIEIDAPAGTLSFTATDAAGQIRDHFVIRK